MTNANSAWHYIEIDNEQKETIKGPFDLAGLKALYNRNAIDEFTFLWTEGMPKWQRLMDLEVVHQVSTSKIIRVKRSG